MIEFTVHHSTSLAAFSSWSRVSHILQSTSLTSFINVWGSMTSDATKSSIRVLSWKSFRIRSHVQGSSASAMVWSNISGVTQPQRGKLSRPWRASWFPPRETSKSGTSKLCWRKCHVQRGFDILAEQSMRRVMTVKTFVKYECDLAATNWSVCDVLVIFKSFNRRCVVQGFNIQRTEWIVIGEIIVGSLLAGCLLFPALGAWKYVLTNDLSSTNQTGFAWRFSSITLGFSLSADCAPATVAGVLLWHILHVPWSVDGEKAKLSRYRRRGKDAGWYGSGRVGKEDHDGVSTILIPFSGSQCCFEMCLPSHEMWQALSGHWMIRRLLHTTHHHLGLVREVSWVIYARCDACTSSVWGWWHSMETHIVLRSPNALLGTASREWTYPSNGEVHYPLLQFQVSVSLSNISYGRVTSCHPPTYRLAWRSSDHPSPKSVRVEKSYEGYAKCSEDCPNRNSKTTSLLDTKGLM